MMNWHLETRILSTFQAVICTVILLCGQRSLCVSYRAKTTLRMTKSYVIRFIKLSVLTLHFGEPILWEIRIEHVNGFT